MQFHLSPIAFPSRSLQKSLIISKLTWLSLFLSLVIRLGTPYKIYYVDLGDYFKSRLGMIDHLERYGLYWIKKQYVHCSDYEKGYFVAGQFVEAIYREIEKASLVKEFSKKFEIMGEMEKKAAVMWKKNIYDFILPLADQFAAGHFLLKKKNHTEVIIVTRYRQASLDFSPIREHFKIFIIPVPISLSGTLLRSIFRHFVSLGKIKKALRAGTHPQRNVEEAERRPSTPKMGVSCEDWAVVYFPHQGVFYGQLFIKDHFYSEDAESPLHKTRIFHVSIREKGQPYLDKSLRFYEKNGIPHGDLVDFDPPAKESLLQLITFLNGVRLFGDLWKYGIDIVVVLLQTIYSFGRYREFVRKCRSLKVALVGYDYLFPCELSLALSLNNVRVCAVQERVIQAFYPMTYYLFDYYYVAGKAVIAKGLKNSKVNQLLPVGLVRADLLYDYESKNIPDDKYDSIKKKKKLVLALDYHLPENDYEDASRSVAKVHQNRKFYEDLLSLAGEFHTLHIVIKGKFTEFYSSPYIADLVELIRQRENIEIEMDFDKYNPYYLGEKADLTISCHTSLADELLAAGRKVIFYEMSDYMELYLNYENIPIIVSDYASLREHVRKIVNGDYLDTEKEEFLRSNYYSDCYHGRVRYEIQSHLESIISAAHP